jgi:hypothetical protein
MRKKTATVDDTAEELTPLQELEAEFGFTFGTDGSEDTAGASPAHSVVCTAPTCKMRNQHIQLHSDTLLPAHCGGCGQVLYCDHVDTLPVEHYEGTLSAPLRVNRVVCVACQSEVSRLVTEMTAIPLDSIPLHLLGGVNLDNIVKATS